MLEPVTVLPRRVDDYAGVVEPEILQEVQDLAARLSGAHILHVNSTAHGGGVAELLASAVPLTQALGLDAEWRVIEGSPGFFEVTKSMHNALQGKEIPWDSQTERLYLEQVRANAKRWSDEYDVVVIHDPQPAAMLVALTDLAGARPSGAWIWRCHIDLTTHFRPVWNFLRPFVEAYDASVFTMEDFVPADLESPLVRLIAPSIDPLSVKNIRLPFEAGRSFLQAFGLDDRRPIILQVSRFDPWKDPIGVIDSYRIVKKQLPDVQLLLAGAMAGDDPEGTMLFEDVSAHAGDDLDIHLLTNLDGVGAAEINGFQTGSDVVLQKSLREGFGLTVTEAMWKQRPVIGGRTGGIRLQIEDGVSGYLVDSVEVCAVRIAEVLKDPQRAARIGDAARERVRTSFTTVHLVRDWLQLMAEVTGS